APPDGSMSDYMASLRKLARRPELIYLPGHGGAVTEAQRFVRSYIHRRQAREAAILRRLGKGDTDIPAIVGATYPGLDPRLTKAAQLSVLAHLEDLVARGMVVTDGQPALDRSYRLVRSRVDCSFLAAGFFFSRSGSAARSGVSPRPSAARCAGAPPSNPSSATSRRITAWAATISPAAMATASTPCSPLPATTSACSCAGSRSFYTPSRWSFATPSWPPRFT